MISELRTFQTYEHPRFPGVRNSEVLLYCQIIYLYLIYVLGSFLGQLSAYQSQATENLVFPHAYIHSSFYLFCVQLSMLCLHTFIYLFILCAALYVMLTYIHLFIYSVCSSLCYAYIHSSTYLFCVQLSVDVRCQLIKTCIHFCQDHILHETSSCSKKDKLVVQFQQ